MKILLVNDDGFYSEGLNILDQVLSSRGHEVWVCAPETQRSACSHAVTMHKPVKIQKQSERHYICDGFPADCVLFSLLGAIPIGKPDLVISGINQGFNFSTDTVYSATVAGADEGALKGIPSIALSCETVVKEPGHENEFPKQRNFKDFPFNEAAFFIADNLDMLYKTIEIGSFLNINVPDNAKALWKTAKIGRIEFYDVVDEVSPNLFQLRGSAFPDVYAKNLEETDYYVLFIEKKIAVTALKTKLRYNNEMQEKLSSLS